MSKPNILPSLLALIPDSHISDYSYTNIIDLHVGKIENELKALDHRNSEAASRTILAVWRRMRRYYEMRGRYEDGIKFASIFRRAAQKLKLKADAAWILLKDDLWLRVLSGEQSTNIPNYFKQAVDEMSDLYEHGTNLEERQNGGIGLFTAYRYMAGYLRNPPGFFKLPNTNDHFTREIALEKCKDVLNMIGADQILNNGDLTTLRARLEQTAGTIALMQGKAHEALAKYNCAAEIFSQLAPDDDEHLSIVKCYQAQGHIASAQNTFESHSFRGARRFSTEFRKRKHDANEHITNAIGLLHEAYMHAANAGWAEGDPRISEHMAHAFELEGRIDLAIMFSQRSLKGYRRLKIMKHVGRVEESLHQLRFRDDFYNANRPDFDILVLGRMRLDMDTKRLIAIQELCNSMTRDSQPIRARRVDELVDPVGGRITDVLIDALWSAELVVAILDGLSPNVLYEVGVAHGCGKPVVLCLGTGEETASMPFDLKDYHIVRFKSLIDLPNKLRGPISREMNIST